ncbi:MAG: carbohydrate kinase family protein [Bdellovibrionales bacterium]
MTKKYDLITFDIPYLDYIVPVSFDDIQALGLPLGSSSHKADLNDCLQLAARYGCRAMPGGALSNAAATAAALGHTCAHFGVTGPDEAGDTIRTNFAARGITDLYIRTDESTRSPFLYALLTPDNDRTFATFPGSGDTMLPENLPPELEKKGRIFFGLARVIVRSGADAFLGPLFAAARAQGATVAINLHASKAIDPFAARARDFTTRYGDIVIGNETEFSVYLDTNDPESELHKPRYDDKTYVMTRGSKDIFVRTAEGVQTFPVTPCDQITDSIGAGDNFAAGFLSGILDGQPLEACIQRGHACASEILGIEGGQPPLGADWRHLRRR